MCKELQRDLAQKNAELHVENAELKKEIENMKNGMTALIKASGTMGLNMDIQTRG